MLKNFSYLRHFLLSKTSFLSKLFSSSFSNLRPYADVMPVIKVQSDDAEHDQAPSEQTGKVELNNWSQFRENDARKAFVSIMRG